MSRPPFVAVDVRDTLIRHGLDSFEALWALEVDAVDAPNIGRGGWSRVYRLELEDANGRPQTFYLKRQQNYLIRSWRYPLGEPTFARELRAIQTFARKGVSALEAAFYDERQVESGRQAILLTRALDEHRSLGAWFRRWHRLTKAQRINLIHAAAALVCSLHHSRIVHNCLYPKHIFLKLYDEGAGARLIDLEKARYSLGLRERSRDLETLHRRSIAPSRTERLRFLLAYLGKRRVDAEVRKMVRLVLRRHRRKGT